MSNYLGHDNDSEISTLIKRIRERKVSIINNFIDDNSYGSILFELSLTYYRTVPVPNSYTHKIRYCIEHKLFENKSQFVFWQINGDESRVLSLTDGYIIWHLLNEIIEPDFLK